MPSPPFRIPGGCTPRAGGPFRIPGGHIPRAGGPFRIPGGCTPRAGGPFRIPGGHIPRAGASLFAPFLTAKIRSTVVAIGAIFCTLVPSGAVLAANSDDDNPVHVLPDVEIIARSPLAGSGVPVSEATSSVQVIVGDVLRQSIDLADALNRNIAGVNINNVQNNPFQKDVQFRGYTASPLLGVPQGIAVYQNGIRVNEAFGDVVQWDTIPEFAIDEVQVISGANPVFGLNALGGAISLRMKTGFDNPGIRANLSGGSFGRIMAGGEAGLITEDEKWAGFFGFQVFSESGWRDYSDSDLQQIYGDVRTRHDAYEIGFNLAMASSNLRGNGPVPIQLLKQRRKSVYTHPDITENTSVLLAVDGSADVSTNLSIQGNMYYRHRNRDTYNGDEFDSVRCSENPDGTPSLNPTGDLLCTGDDDDDDDDDDNNGGDDDDDNNGGGNNGGDDDDDNNGGGNNNGGDDDDGDAEAEAPAFLIDTNGDKIKAADFDGDHANGAINRSRTRTNAFGFNFQGVYDSLLFDRHNAFLAGLSFEYAKVDFVNGSELGTLNETRGIDGSNIFLNSPDFGVPTGLDSKVYHLGLFFSDTIRLTDPLSLTLSGRWNHTKIEMEDRHGTDLDGSHTYNRFNPSVGANYRLASNWHAFAQYSEANRVPTPSELSCADPEKSCRLPNAFVADPPLEQVVNRSIEIGMRGNVSPLGGKMRWQASLFGGENSDDIIFVAGKKIGTGYFRNAGKTRRIGAELGLNGTMDMVDWFFNYAYVQATFRDPFQVNAPGHPKRDENDQIEVRAGDRIPGIPLHNLKFGGGIRPVDPWRIGFETMVASSQYLRGDESNQLETLPAYAVVNLESDYRFNDHVTAFLQIHNVFNTDYETFGVVAENPSEVLGSGYDDARFLSPAPPLGIWAGIRLSY